MKKFIFVITTYGMISQLSASTCDSYVALVKLKSNLESRRLPATMGGLSFTLIGSDMRIQTYKISDVYTRYLVVNDPKVLLYWGSRPSHSLAYKDLLVMNELCRQISVGNFPYFDLESSKFKYNPGAAVRTFTVHIIGRGYFGKASFDNKTLEVISDLVCTNSNGSVYHRSN